MNHSPDIDRGGRDDADRDGRGGARRESGDHTDRTGTATDPPRQPQFVDKEGTRWTLRQADEADLDWLVALYDAFGDADRAQGIPPAVEHRRRSWIEMLLEEGYNIVAEGDGRVVGHIVYTPLEDACPELAIFVHPAFHDRGIGTELCRRLVASAAAADREALELFVELRNRAAISVYRRVGFETVDSDHEVRMVHPLEDPSVSAVGSPPRDA